ncbi:MAG TPA: hypothetical protein VG939_21865 [Caulobacteraceae bacterium]|nr:hypothetical protein [Caulobacteraceae bacterium]
MPIQTIKNDTRDLLKEADKKVALAERRLAEGTPAEKVQAAGDLSVLKRHRAELAARLDELDKAKDGALPTLAERLKEEGMLLRQALENFSIHH